MLTAERRNYILNQIKLEGRVVAQSLSDELGVSIDTIRRDLRDMAAEGLLQRVHGGALRASPAINSYVDRQRHLSAEKVAVARAAARLVENGMVVVIGGGITNVQAARHLAPDLRAVIITHSPPVAEALAEHPDVDVILIGGKVFKHSLVTVGAETVEAFRSIRADLCLLGVCSIHPETGISIPDYEEALVQRAMIACSAEIAALASSEKLGTAAPFGVAALNELNLIITDDGVDPATVELYRARGIEVIVA